MENRILTPQQEMFLAEYTNPKSDNFGNAKTSALKAGYEESYADNITTLMPDWLLENIGDMKRLRKSEKNIEEVQNLDIMGQDGKVDNQTLANRLKVDLFVAERLGKNKYSTRSEHTGKDGEPIYLPSEIINKNNVSIPSNTENSSE